MICNLKNTKDDKIIRENFNKIYKNIENNDSKLNILTNTLLPNKCDSFINYFPNIINEPWYCYFLNKFDKIIFCKKSNLIIPYENCVKLFIFIFNNQEIEKLINATHKKYYEIILHTLNIQLFS